MHRFFLLFLIFIAGFAKPALAVEAVANHAIFRTAAGEAHIELYWSIIPATLHYRKDSAGRLVARIRTQMRISGDTGIVYKKAYYLQTNPFDPDKGDAEPILEIVRAAIPEGHVRMELYLSEDGHPEGVFYYKDTMVVSAPKAPEYSSLQLLDTFFAAKSSGPFEKGGYLQYPRVLHFFDEGQRRLHAYMELYRTQDLPPASFPLTQLLYITNSRGERNMSEPVIIDSIAVGAPVHPFRHSFSLAALPSGNYYLNRSLRTAAGTELHSDALFFQTINRHPEVKADTSHDTAAAAAMQVAGTILDLSKTFVSKFQMPQLRAILKMIQPAAGAGEVAAIRGFLEQPDDLYMRYFIYNHFLAINKADPGKAWKSFSDVVREINRQYSSGSTMGYETDRGIIYLRFGPPAEVIRVPSETGAQPYEIWRYNVGGKIGGSGLFLFYSPGFMLSDYRLLHSTLPGERQNPGWRSLLYTGVQSGATPNNRAEQYFSK